jgi:hypothetical protein
MAPVDAQIGSNGEFFASTGTKDSAVIADSQAHFRTPGAGEIADPSQDFQFAARKFRVFPAFSHVTNRG